MQAEGKLKNSEVLQKFYKSREEPPLLLKKDFNR